MNQEPPLVITSFIRWQGITIKHMSYSINLVIVLSVGSLGYSVSILPGVAFEQICFSKCFLAFGMVSLILSIGAGLWATLNRLKDFRITAQIARGKEPSARERLRDLTTELGDRTWLLFRSQVALFCFGFVSLLVAICMIHKDKLF